MSWLVPAADEHSLIGARRQAAHRKSKSGQRAASALDFATRCRQQRGVDGAARAGVRSKLRRHERAVADHTWTWLVRVVPCDVRSSGTSIVPEEAELGWQNVARFIGAAVATYDADWARVYIAGFSQGAIMAIATMLTSPERLAGVVAMSGRLLPEVLPHAVAADRLRDKKMLIVHGTAEQVIGIQFGRSASEQLSRFPFELTYCELGMGHTITLESCGVVSAWLSAALDSWIGIPPRATTTAPSTESPDTH